MLLCLAPGTQVSNGVGSATNAPGALSGELLYFAVFSSHGLCYHAVLAQAHGSCLRFIVDSQVVAYAKRGFSFLIALVRSLFMLISWLVIVDYDESIAGITQAKLIIASS